MKSFIINTFEYQKIEGVFTVAAGFRSSSRPGLR